MEIQERTLLSEIRLHENLPFVVTVQPPVLVRGLATILVRLQYGTVPYTIRLVPYFFRILFLLRECSVLVRIWGTFLVPVVRSSSFVTSLVMRRRKNLGRQRPREHQGGRKGGQDGRHSADT